MSASGPQTDESSTSPCWEPVGRKTVAKVRLKRPMNKRSLFDGRLVGRRLGRVGRQLRRNCLEVDERAALGEVCRRGAVDRVLVDERRAVFSQRDQ